MAPMTDKHRSASIRAADACAALAAMMYLITTTSDYLHRLD